VFADNTVEPTTPTAVTDAPSRTLDDLMKDGKEKHTYLYRSKQQMITINTVNSIHLVVRCSLYNVLERMHMEM